MNQYDRADRDGSASACVGGIDPAFVKGTEAARTAILAGSSSTADRPVTGMVPISNTLADSRSPLSGRSADRALVPAGRKSCRAGLVEVSSNSSS